MKYLGDKTSGAVFSECDRYRYSLWRTWTDSGLLGRMCTFICLNCSTATHNTEDPTVRRCIRFSKDWGCDGYVMLNLFAFRATDPDDYPPEKTAYALRAPDRVVRRAADLGPNVEAFAARLFEGPLPWAKLRGGLKLVSLGEKYGGERLDAACARALSYDLVDVRRLHSILLRALDTEERPVEEATVPLGSRFARPPGAFDHRQQRLVEVTV